MNVDNDLVELYEDKSGEWRWRRKDRANGEIVSDGSEGYTTPARAYEAAYDLNPGVEIVRID